MAIAREAKPVSSLHEVREAGLDRERGREARTAGRTAAAHLASAGGASRRHLGFRLLEVALRVAAGEAERDPVAERLAPLLAEPVGGLAHGFSVLAVG